MILIADVDHTRHEVQTTEPQRALILYERRNTTLNSAAVKKLRVDIHISLQAE